MCLELQRLEYEAPCDENFATVPWEQSTELTWEISQEAEEWSNMKHGFRILKIVS